MLTYLDYLLWREDLGISVVQSSISPNSDISVEWIITDRKMGRLVIALAAVPGFCGYRVNCF